jgi:sulfur relay (sulfurtransferase) complex TusBCD TusD component (DsrE family)
MGTDPTADRATAGCDRRTLSILLTHGPDSADARRIAGLLAAAAGQGIAARLFLMADGVANVERGPIVPWLGRTEVTVCAVNAEATGVVPRPDVRLGSQHDHMVQVTTSDRVVTFA